MQCPPSARVNRLCVIQHTKSTRSRCQLNQCQTDEQISLTTQTSRNTRPQTPSIEPGDRHALPHPSTQPRTPSIQAKSHSSSSARPAPASPADSAVCADTSRTQRRRSRAHQARLRFSRAGKPDCAPPPWSTRAWIPPRGLVVTDSPEGSPRDTPEDSLLPPTGRRRRPPCAAPPPPSSYSAAPPAPRTASC